MSEKTMRSNVLSLLREAGLDATAVENSVHPGTPDVNYGGTVVDGPDVDHLTERRVEGWLELKVLEKWPSRAGDVVRMPLVRPEQRVWIDRRHRAGGRVFVLLRVGGEYLLFDGTVAFDLGKLTEKQMREAARAQFSSLAGLRKDLVECL